MSSGPERPTWKVSEKPERPVSLFVTLTLFRDSARSSGTGTAIPGPIISVRCIPKSDNLPSSLSGLRDGDAQDASGLRRQVEGVHGVVGVGDAPEVLRVAERARGYKVQAVALRHRDLDEQRHRRALRQKPSALVDGLAPVGEL